MLLTVRGLDAAVGAPEAGGLPKDEGVRQPSAPPCRDFRGCRGKVGNPKPKAGCAIAPLGLLAAGLRSLASGPRPLINRWKVPAEELQAATGLAPAGSGARAGAI